jgi:iron(II)-dependent oxidoreductase
MPEVIEVTGGVKGAVASQLEEARERTLALVEPLSEDDLTRQHSALQSPIVWDLAHIAHFEELWLVRGLTGEAPLHPEGDDVYDAFQHARADRVELPLLSAAAARAFLADIRTRTLAVLAGIDLDPAERLLADAFVYGLVIQHELQHVETMLQTIQLSGLPHPGGRPRANDHQDGEALIGSGSFVQGTDSQPWAYDNERPAHEVELPAFTIDRSPVSNRAYAEFLRAGGWDEPPLHWERGPDGWLRRRFGTLEPVPPDEPVQHVSWYEADAFARWAGRRLPSEAEWEKAASLGLLDNVGQVWEWTSSDFGGYPGFEAFPYAEYSEVFFGAEYKVLRGGSWATHPTVARVTFRNWDFPIRRQIFSGFRCARDV